MKFNFGIVVIVAYLGSVESIDFNNIFGWFLNPIFTPFKRIKRAIASDCKILQNRRSCKFSTSNLKFDSDNSIELVVNAGGRAIKCDKTLSKGYKGWYGSCDGDADDANFITSIDKNGVEKVFGSIQAGDDVCHIAPNVNGEQEITCKPKSEFKAEDAPIDALTRGISGRQLTVDTKFGFVPMFNQNKTNPLLRGSNQEGNGRMLYDDAGGNIDVMVIWTKAAECTKAGLPSGCVVSSTTESIMRGLIDLAVAETNTAFTLSGIFTTLRLVHAYRDPTYNEVSGDFYTNLDRVTNNNDGYMDSVHSKRALYGADMVHMILGDTSSCGLAWSGILSSEYMFSVSSYLCTTGYYSFGHEIGHNLNLLHDSGTENSCSGTSYNYGYRDPNAAFRTILSYDCSMGQCDNMPKNGCSRIQRFSNSNTAYTYNGKKIGDATRDNARQFNSQRVRVAALFPAMNCQTDSECNDGDLTTIDTCNTANRVCVFSPRPPTRSPTKAPTKSPTKAPTRPPTKGPTKSPTTAPIPVQLVTKSPTKSPTNTPIAAPTNSPIKPPTNSPIKPPTNSPIKPPTNAPLRPPTKAPTRAPVRLPTKSPTKAPVLPQVFYMESMKITNVNSTTWRVVTLSQQYISPIPVCTVVYNMGPSLLPAVVRMQRVATTSFEIRLQNPSDTSLTSRDVHCVIVEEGAWKLPDGRLIESKKYSSTVTDRKGSWSGQVQTYRNRYNKPVVLGQVMSYNDARWSVFWSRSSSGANIAPSSTSLLTGKHVGEDSRQTRLAETVGYIVIETGHLTSSSIEIETGRGPDAFISYTSTKSSFAFAKRFATTPAVAVLSQAAMDDSDGSWAVITSIPTTSSMGIAVDEDQNSDVERTHSTEEVNYAVFAKPGAIQLIKV